MTDFANKYLAVINILSIYLGDSPPTSLQEEKGGVLEKTKRRKSKKVNKTKAVGLAAML